MNHGILSRGIAGVAGKHKATGSQSGGRLLKKYFIFYRPTSEGVEIVRVLHSARDLPALFAGGMDVEKSENSLADAKRKAA